MGRREKEGAIREGRKKERRRKDEEKIEGEGKMERRGGEGWGEWEHWYTRATQSSLLPQ